MKHKRHRPKQRRAGCLFCKPWKGEKARNLKPGPQHTRQHHRHLVTAEEQEAPEEGGFHVVGAERVPFIATDWRDYLS